MVLTAGFAPALAALSTPCLYKLGYASRQIVDLGLPIFDWVALWAARSRNRQSAIRNRKSKNIPGRSLPPAHASVRGEGRSIYFALGDVFSS